MIHTPGPWVIDDGCVNWTIRDADGEFVSYITKSRYCDEREDPTANANARLIAAAPDLLAALRELEAWAALVTKGECAELTPARVQARAAIAQAEGK